MAQFKLDLRDDFESKLGENDDKEKALRIFNEELEAFCSDLRLAAVTVQAQVEREEKKKSG